MEQTGNQTGPVEKEENSWKRSGCLLLKDYVLSGYNCRYRTKAGCPSARGWHENEDNEENEVGSSYIGGKFRSLSLDFLSGG